MKQPPNKRKQWIAGSVLLAITLCWCVVAGRVIYYAGDYMIGFDPLLLFLLPYTAGLGLAAIVGCAMRKWRFAGMAGVCVVAVLVLFSQSYRIGLWAWSQSIRQYDVPNQEAISRSTAIPELTDDTLTENIWKDKALPVLDGFRWYCTHHLASPGGTFRAFRYRGDVHVRIQKIRHGYRGIAFITTPEEKERLAKNSQLIYEDGLPIGNHWVIWRSY
jgi:hypothetical protein